MARCHLVQNVLKRIDQFEQADADHLIILHTFQDVAVGPAGKGFFSQQVALRQLFGRRFDTKVFQQGSGDLQPGVLFLFFTAVPAEASWI
jgi:hypothetical protein